MAEILIIGGGVAGLSAGIYARLSGHKVTLCEKHTKTGGNLTGWQRGEYHIDNCIHWLTGTNPVTDNYKMWTELGALGDVEIYQSDSLYTYDGDGMRLTLYKSLDKTEKEMLLLSPKDRREILSLTAAVRAVQGIDGIAGEHHNIKKSTLSIATSLPSLLKYHCMSTGELAMRFHSPVLRGFLTAIMGECFSALALITVFATFTGENGGIPKGGSLNMARRMSERLISIGGSILTGAEVTKIVEEKGRAKLAVLRDGREISFDYLVIAADPNAVFEKLLSAKMPADIRKMYKSSKMQTFSSCHTAFSSATQDLPFKGDFIFELPDEYKRILRSRNLIVREFSHEEECAKKGNTVIQTMTFCTEKESRRFIRLKESIEKYRNKKREIADASERVLTMKFPKLKGKLECIDVWTPATYHRYTGAQTGSYMSFILPKKYIPTIPKVKVEGYQNVVLASQWSTPPGGLPIAAAAGKRAVKVINSMISNK